MASEVAGTTCPLLHLSKIVLTSKRGCRDKARVSDRVLEKEKGRQVGQVFDARFSWSEMADAVADVYLGVSASFHSADLSLTSDSTVHLLEYPHLSRCSRLVLPTLAHGHLRLRSGRHVHRLTLFAWNTCHPSFNFLKFAIGADDDDSRSLCIHDQVSRE